MEQRELTLAPESVACGWTAGWRNSAGYFPAASCKT